MLKASNAAKHCTSLIGLLLRHIRVAHGHVSDQPGDLQLYHAEFNLMDEHHWSVARMIGAFLSAPLYQTSYVDGAAPKSEDVISRNYAAGGLQWPLNVAVRSHTPRATFVRAVPLIYV